MRPKEILQQWVNHFNNADAQAMTELYADDAINHQVANEPIVRKRGYWKSSKR